LKEGLIFTSLFGVIASVGGLFLSMGADLPVGASITVSAVALLAIVNLLKNKLNFRRRS
jgi:ABC-type Mn2+/Zn2+ transport system permease subunit